jgi:hypothetical protein
MCVANDDKLKLMQAIENRSDEMDGGLVGHGDSAIWRLGSVGGF